MIKRLALCCVVLIPVVVACAGDSQPAEAPELLEVQYTAAAAGWLEQLEGCLPEGAPPVHAQERAAAFLDPSADLALRLGEPPDLLQPAYDLGSVEIVFIVNRLNPVGELDLQQARDLFSGRLRDWSELGGEAGTVQTWTYPQGEDLQQVLEAQVLQGQPPDSLAHLALDPGDVLQGVSLDPQALGFVPRPLATNEVRIVESSHDLAEALTVPVLAITPAEPGQELLDWIGCLQQ